MFVETIRMERIQIIRQLKMSIGEIKPYFCVLWIWNLT